MMLDIIHVPVAASSMKASSTSLPRFSISLILASVLLPQRAFRTPTASVFSAAKMAFAVQRMQIRKAKSAVLLRDTRWVLAYQYFWLADGWPWQSKYFVLKCERENFTFSIFPTSLQHMQIELFDCLHVHPNEAVKLQWRAPPILNHCNTQNCWRTTEPCYRHTIDVRYECTGKIRLWS